MHPTETNMLSTFIALFMSVSCFAIGVAGLYRVVTDKVPSDKEGVALVVSAALIALAWGAAKLGGI